MTVTDPFMADIRPSGIQRGRGGFYRSADDAPYVTDPAGELCKTVPRKGEIKRLKYASPSSVGRLIENDAGLVKYKQRLSFLGIGMDTGLAEACRDLVTLETGSPEFKTAADAIAVAADTLTRSWLAADRGTHGHAICEAIDLNNSNLLHRLYTDGADLDLDLGKCLEVAAAWIDLLETNRLEVLAVEAACVDDGWRVAGTLDRIVRLGCELRFVKPDGEIVTIPAGTVLILDIKFGACRRAHAIQIASYARSVPYDTALEQRNVWPWPIDQTHALIAQGVFGDPFTPASINLVWVDLTAGREHGGQCVANARAWGNRDDLFSVAQNIA